MGRSFKFVEKPRLNSSDELSNYNSLLATIQDHWSVLQVSQISEKQKNICRNAYRGSEAKALVQDESGIGRVAQLPVWMW